MIPDENNETNEKNETNNINNLSDEEKNKEQTLNQEAENVRKEVGDGQENNKEAEYSFDGSSSSYSMSGSDIPENKTFVSKRPSEFELSYDSKSGAYTRKEYADKSGAGSDLSAIWQSYTENKKASRRSKRTIALCVLISVISGALAALAICVFAIRSGVVERGNVSYEDTNMKVNYAEIKENAVIAASEIANKTVVAIDTYTQTASPSGATKVGAGSGVILSEAGYIVTCNHVVENAETVLVTLSTGDRFEASVVGRDTQTDLAVIKINVSGDLPAATLRGTGLILGETVVAIGNPLGALSNTVTDGIISSLERQITIEGQTMTLIQTNAAVNHGNSGGGLFDSNGSLVGIVNAKSADVSVEGIGFAIPISTVKTVTKDLIEKGYVSGRASYGFDGVYITPQNYSRYPELREYAVSGTWIQRITQGFYITDTANVAGYAEGSSKLRFGDRIERVGEVEITSQNDLNAALGAYSPGDTVSLSVVRDHNTTIIINLILSELK